MNDSLFELFAFVIKLAKIEVHLLTMASERDCTKLELCVWQSKPLSIFWNERIDSTICKCFIRRILCIINA